MKTMRRVLLLLLLAAFGPPAGTRINVVSLPGRDSVQLTIYNSVDLTVVAERRALTFRRGLNRLEFSWANTLIDPTSVEFKAVTHADEIEVMDVSFPPRTPNTLEWRINSEFAGEAIVEIRYFTSGISWLADYVVQAEPRESAMSFAGAVRVSNQSGEDYENAEIRLVVGTVRLVEEIVQLARQKLPQAPMRTSGLMVADNELGKSVKLAMNGAMDRMEVAAKRKDVVKEALSEYFLYTVEGRDTVPNGWSKRLPSFLAEAVPITSLYKFERETWGNSVMRYYRFTNSAPAQLGKEPLPDGSVIALRTINEELLSAFVGRTSVKYIPIDEVVELELGPDQEVLVRPTLANWTKADLAFDRHGNVIGWTTTETWKVEVQNSKEIPVMIDVRRRFDGDWTLNTNATYDQMDARRAKFLLPLQPRESQEFEYQVTTRHGTNARR
jgi:hypothetical protein